MRKLIAILFLGIWLINFWFASAFFMIQLYHQKQLMRELLASTPRHQLTALYLTASAFEDALYEEHELKINDCMFDIAFTEQNGDQIIVYGLFDNDENELLALLKDHSREQTDDKRTNKTISHFITLSFVPPEKIGYSTPAEDQEINITLLHTIYDSIARTIDCPPPQG